MSWNERIPGTHNFTWGEFFTTRHDQEALRREFLALPAPEQEKIRTNLIALANRIQMIRDFYAKPITITSGWRSQRVNAAVGGARNSYHLCGMAADIVVQEVAPGTLQQRYTNWSGGLGLNPSFTHLDIRPTRARFTY
jgi:uncharacterized protein YcbK (DUF882 family)